MLLFFFLGETSKITEEDLIGGEWVATAGYKNGKAEGEPVCTDYLMEGLEFKQDGVAYGGKLDEEFEYSVKYSKEGRSEERRVGKGGRGGGRRGTGEKGCTSERGSGGRG